MQNDSESGPPLALTIGEPGGIGLDLTLRLWNDRARNPVPAFYLVAPEMFAKTRARDLGLDIPTLACTPDEAIRAFDKALPVVPIEAHGTPVAGTADPACAPTVLSAIARAVADTQSGHAAAVVTNPIQKKTLYDAGFDHPGHTEYLGELAGHHSGARHRPVMMLAGPDLKVVPVTVHVPLADVPSLLTTDAIVETAQIVDADMKARFAILEPRIAVTGLNPHAGENDALGTEDNAIIRPAVARLNAMGIAASGPLPADTLFHAAARATYDVAIAMYHDQALIPVKAIAFDETVNVTLGLPFVRTSPDHGTALDLAGTGRGNTTSLRQALILADRLARVESANGD